MKLLDRSNINKILVISLTNIGDVILTFPVIDILKEDFPAAKLSLVIGPKASSLFCGNPHMDKVYIFDKHQAPLKTLSWILELRRERFDLVVDLRNTAIPFMIASRCRTSCRVEKIMDRHMRAKHLDHLRSVHETQKEYGEKRALFISEAEQSFVRELIDREIGRSQHYVIVAAGAADSAKRWPEENFAAVCDYLAREYRVKVVFVGDGEDGKVTQRVMRLMGTQAVNLCARTNLVQLAELFKHCSFALVNDSAPLHMASYLDVPVLALFGPSDPQKYGPWGEKRPHDQKRYSLPGMHRSKEFFISLVHARHIERRCS